MTENTNPCYETTRREGEQPDACFEGTPNDDECIILVKGGYWEDCRYGGKWRKIE